MVNKVNFYPISTTFYVNTICNYRCSFCFLINDDHKGSKKFNLDLEGFYKLLNHKHIKYSGRVTLGGGEPYLNKNIYDFIKELKKRKKITSIYTNGLLAWYKVAYAQTLTVVSLHLQLITP